MNWDPVVNELIKVVLLAFFIERALAVIFDMERVEPVVERRDLKPVIAMGVSIALCYGLRINVIGALAAPGSSLAGSLEWLGFALTGLVVAGGSAGAVKLFQDVLGLRRSLRDETKVADQAKRSAEASESLARTERAQAEVVSARADMRDSAARLATAPQAPADQALEERIAARKLKIQRGQ